MTEGYSDWTGINKYTFDDGQHSAIWYDESGNFVGDGLTELLPEDDAATVNWGSQWQTPSKAQFQELLDNTTREDKEINGVVGRLYTGTNGNSIFFPTAGYCDGAFQTTGGSTYYWTRETMDCSDYGGCCYESTVTYNSRTFGFPIRPVMKP